MYLFFEIKYYMAEQKYLVLIQISNDDIGWHSFISPFFRGWDRTSPNGLQCIIWPVVEFPISVSQVLKIQDQDLKRLKI